MKISPSDVSNKEILSVLQTMQGDMKFMQGDLKDLKQGQGDLSESIQGLAQLTDERLVAVEREQMRMRAVMVTKDYLDDKLADLKSDLRQDTARQIEKVLK